MQKNADQAFRMFQRQLRRYIAGRLGDGAQVDDILQEVFVRVVRNEKAFAAATKPLAWLHTVTNSVLVDYFRKQRRGVETVDYDISNVSASGDETPEDDGFGRCLTPLIENLPEKYRAALAFTDLEGGKQVDFARSQNLNTATAKSRVQRGRKMLKQSIIGCCQVELDHRRNVVGLSPQTVDDEPCC